MQTHVDRPQPRFRFRALITLLTGVAFAVMTVSGGVLYIAPRGRVANWRNWKLAGLEKEQWSDLHMTAAVLLLVAIGFHLYFNWKPLVYYFKSRSAAHRVRLRELVVALVLVLALVVGTLGEVPPLRFVLTMNAAIKEAWESRAGPVGRAPSTQVQEGTVREFASQMGLAVERLQEVLEAHGVEAMDADAPIDAVARQHGLTLQQIYEAALAGGDREAQPRRGQGGRGQGGSSGEGQGVGRDGGDSSSDGEGRGGGGRFGQMTLAEFCHSASVPLSDALDKLKAQNIEATQTTRLRDLSTQLGMTPRQTADWLKQ